MYTPTAALPYTVVFTSGLQIPFDSTTTFSRQATAIVATSEGGTWRADIAHIAQIKTMSGQLLISSLPIYSASSASGKPAAARPLLCPIDGCTPPPPRPVLAASIALAQDETRVVEDGTSPDFVVPQGGSLMPTGGLFYETCNSNCGTSQSTTWTTSGLPTGVTVLFDPNPSVGATSDTSTPIITADSSAAIGISLAYVSESTRVSYDGGSYVVNGSLPIIIEVIAPTTMLGNVAPAVGSTSAARIQRKALEFYKHSTCYLYPGVGGPSAGDQCVAAVQKVLENAGLPKFLDSHGNVIIGVDVFAPALAPAAAAGTVTNLGLGTAAQALAGPGDIWVQGYGHPGKQKGPGGAGQWHVGICLSKGCTLMISNDSYTPPCSFEWVASPDQMEGYFLRHEGSNWPSGYFHVN